MFKKNITILNKMQAYQKALKNATDSEKSEILSGIGISSLFREKDLKNYIHLLERESDEELENQTDFEMLENLSQKEINHAQMIPTRKALIKYVKEINSPQKTDNSSYSKCLETARKKNLKLCPEGYCTAKEKFEVYPSAYANAYAVQVCKGDKPDLEGNYVDRYGTEKEDQESGLSRWFKEEWINVCEKDGKGDYLPCGRKKASLKPKDYPYCRPLNKLPGTTVKTVSELSAAQILEMCKKKRSVEQGIDSKPTRVFL